jgi:DNA-binding NarL/FixJ family response regulator
MWSQCSFTGLNAVWRVMQASDTLSGARVWGREHGRFGGAVGIGGEISVLVADDHAAFRGSLRELLEDAGFAVIAEAPDGVNAVRLAEELEPDIVLIDLHMPRMGGVEATRALLKLSPAPTVLVLTASTGSDDVIDAIAAGASGYLLKDARPDEIVGAIRAALAGRSPVSPAAAAAVLARVRDVVREQGAGQELPVLTNNEAEVLRLLVLGRDNHQIADELFMSLSSVKKHVSSVLAKLGVRTRLQAAVLATRAGLV